MQPIPPTSFCLSLEKPSLFHFEEECNEMYLRPGLTITEAKRVLENHKIDIVDITTSIDFNHFLIISLISVVANALLSLVVLKVPPPFSRKLDSCSDSSDPTQGARCDKWLNSREFNTTLTDTNIILFSITSIYLLISLLGRSYTFHVKKNHPAITLNEKIDHLKSTLRGYRQGLLSAEDAVRLFPILAQGNMEGLDLYNFKQLKACRDFHKELFDKLVRIKAFNDQQRPLWRLLQRLEEAKNDPKWTAKILKWDPNQQTFASEPNLFELFLKESNPLTSENIFKLCSKILKRKVLSRPARKKLSFECCSSIVHRVVDTKINLKDAISEAIDPVDALKVSCSLGALCFKVEREIAGILMQNVGQREDLNLEGLDLADLNSLIQFLKSGEVSFFEQYAMLKICKALNIDGLAQKFEDSLVEDVAFLSQQADLYEIAAECSQMQLQLLRAAIDDHLSHESAQTLISFEELMEKYSLPVLQHLPKYQDALRNKIIEQINTLSKMAEPTKLCDEILRQFILIEKIDSDSEFIKLMGKEIKKWVSLHPRDMESLWRWANMKQFSWLIRLTKKYISKNPSLLCSWRNPDSELFDLKSVVEI